MKKHDSNLFKEGEHGFNEAAAEVLQNVNASRMQ